MIKLTYHSYDIEVACRFERELKKALKGIKHSIIEDRFTPSFKYILQIDNISVSDLVDLCKRIDSDFTVQSTKDTIDVY